MPSPAPQTTEEGHLDLDATPARAGERVGLIWVLLISTLCAAAVLLVLFLLFRPHLHNATDTGVVGPSTAENGVFHAPPSQKPPG